MARRVHLHMDLNETDASLIKKAAKLSQVQPPHYVLNRVLRVAELEIKQWKEHRAAPETVGDIDEGSQLPVGGASTGGSGGGGADGVAPSRDEAEETAEDHRKRLARYRKKKGPDFRIAPLI